VTSDDRLLTTSEVAALFRVHRATVIRWAVAGRISSVQIMEGGDRRFRESEIRQLLNGGGTDGIEHQGS